MTSQASYFPVYPTYTETPLAECQWDNSSTYGLLSPPFDSSSSWPTTSNSDSYTSTANFSLPQFKDMVSNDSYPTPNDACYVPRFIDDSNLSNVSSPLLSPLILQQPRTPELFIDTAAFQYKEPVSIAYLQTPLSTPTRESAALSHHSSPEFYNEASSFQLNFPYQQDNSAYTSPLQSPKREILSSSPSASYFDNESYMSDRPDAPCKPFIMKLAHLLRNPDLYADVICWDPAGTSFIIAPSDKMVNTVLPEVFSHSSVAAFSRQLNTYGFIHLNRQQLSEKFQYSPDTTTPVRDLSAWTHPHYFTRDGPSMLHRLLPKPSRARAAHQKAKNTMLMDEGKTLKTAKPKNDPTTKVAKKLKLSWK